MYFDSKFASVEWNDNVKVAVLTWKEFAFGDDFKTPCLKALELAIQNKATKWYSDTRHLGALKEEDTAWFMQEIVSKMLSNGIKKQALIVPQSVISKLSLTSAGEKAKDIGLETKFFDSAENAIEWLKE